jgi:hypothetical protein
MSRDRFLLPLALFLLRAMTPVGRVDALLKLNRLVDLDLAAESEKTSGPPPAGETEVTREPVSSYHTIPGRGQG